MSQLTRFRDWIYHAPSLFEEREPFICFKDVDKPSYPIDDYQGNPRLGFIYQHLCTELITQSRQYDVVLEEVQINDQHGKTLGAIDLILHNKMTGLDEHWEVAIKFYLLHGGTWFGPNAHDQLDKKLERMLNHQLKMSQTPQFRHLHSALSPITERLLLQGRLYTNPFNNELTPTTCLGFNLNQSQICGHWCYQHQFDLIKETLFEIEKVDWAAGGTLVKRPLTQPTARFTHAQSQSGQFWFIVENDWPNNQ
ncbi:DUF1853 family protein [Vibrio agarivorans]|uniref:DUF1853 family protein n=1 Tax=Vibrio agarivorans TaxID=153622 RepID=A0ABT7Y167_9VIBR|nr:DUF1853 family protein [Vibrio agarivorans]MDN2481726.1 DUF1853 family protein [Vibrio agarivorans]